MCPHSTRLHGKCGGSDPPTIVSIRAKPPIDSSSHPRSCYPRPPHTAKARRVSPPVAAGKKTVVYILGTPVSPHLASRVIRASRALFLSKRACPVLFACWRLRSCLRVCRTPLTRQESRAFGCPYTSFVCVCLCGRPGGRGTSGGAAEKGARGAWPPNERTQGRPAGAAVRSERLLKRRRGCWLYWHERAGGKGNETKLLFFFTPVSFLVVGPHSPVR